MHFIRNLTIVVWIFEAHRWLAFTWTVSWQCRMRGIESGPDVPLWKSVIQCGLLMMTNVYSFSCHMIAYYFLVSAIMWNSFLHNVPSVRWCQYPIWFSLGIRMLGRFSWFARWLRKSSWEGRILQLLVKVVKISAVPVVGMSKLVSDE